MSLKLALEIIGGSVTGYLTNKIAVKMLFKEYLGFGGVILKTREDFIENVSELVERDLINHKTLESEFLDAKFDAIFDDSSREIIENLKSENFNIYDFFCDEDIKNLYNFFHINSKKYSAKITNDILQKTRFNDVIGPEIEEKVLESLVVNIEKIVKEKENSSLKEALEENKDLKIADLIDPMVIEKVKINLLEKSAIKDKDSVFESTSKILNEHVESETVSNVIEKLSNRRIIDFLSEESKTRILESMKSVLQSYKESVEYENLKGALVEKLKGRKITLSDLFGESLDDETRRFVNQNFESMIESSKRMIRDEKDSIESLMESSIDEKLQDSPNDLFGMNAKIRETIKGALFGQDKKIDICDQIEGFMDSSLDEAQLKEQLCAKIKEHLKDASFDVEKYQEQIGSIIDREYKKHMESIDAGYIEEKMGMKLGGLFGKDMKGALCSIISDRISDLGMINDRFKKTMDVVFDKVSNMTIEDLVESESVDFISLEKSMILDSIDSNREKIRNLVQNNIFSGFREKYFIDILNSESQKEIIKNFEFEIERILELKYDSFRNSNINKFLEKEETQNKIIENMSGVIRKMTLDNLSIAMEGNVKEIVSKKLSTMNDDKMLELVEEFMGRELKPITVFGAILGALAGLGLYVYKSRIGMDVSAGDYFTSFLVYGGIGWLTNYIALKMIFRPYTDVKLMDKTVFPAGVVVKQKARFAKNMGVFIGDKLLNLNGDFKIEDDKKKGFVESVKSILSKDNYFYLNNYILSNKYKISETLAKLTTGKAKGMLNFIREKSSGKLKTIELRSLFDMKSIKKGDIKEYIVKSSEMDIDEDNIKNYKLDGLVSKFEKIDMGIDVDSGVEAIAHARLLKEDKYQSSIVEFMDIKSLIEREKTNKLLVDVLNEKLGDLFSEKKLGDIEAVKGEIENACHISLGNSPQLIIDWLENNKSSIANASLMRIKGEFGMMYMLAGAFLDLDSMILELMDDFLGEKLQGHIRMNRDELAFKISAQAKEIVFEHRMDQTELAVDGEKGIELLDAIDFFDGLAMKAVADIESHAGRIRLKDIIEQKDIIVKNAFKNAKMLDELQMVEEAAASLRCEVSSSIKKELISKIESLSLSDLDIELKIESILEAENGIRILNDFKAKSIISILDDMESIKLQDIIEDEQFEIIFQNIGKTFEDDQKYKFVSEIYCDLLENVNDSLKKETKENVVDYMLNNLVRVFETKEQRILENLNIKEVVDREINLMHPKEIEDLFNSFASKYFRRLELYGISGGVLGVIVLMITKIF